MTLRWRNPVLLFGDYFLAHTYQSVELPADTRAARPRPDWALDGASGGTGEAKLISSLGTHQAARGRGLRPVRALRWRASPTPQQMLAGEPPRVETLWCDDADVVVVAFGTPARFIRDAVRQLRESGERVGFARPITLVPFPSRGALPSAAQGCRAVAVYENNQGQMVDDVRLAVLGRAPVDLHRRPVDGQLRLRHRPRSRRGAAGRAHPASADGCERAE